MFIIKQYLHTYTNSANNHNINNLSSVCKSVEKKLLYTKHSHLYTKYKSIYHK